MVQNWCTMAGLRATAALAGTGTVYLLFKVFSAAHPSRPRLDIALAARTPYPLASSALLPWLTPWELLSDTTHGAVLPVLAVLLVFSGQNNTNAWQPTLEHGVEYCPCTAPEIIRLTGVLGHLQTGIGCQASPVLRYTAVHGHHTVQCHNGPLSSNPSVYERRRDAAGSGARAATNALLLPVSVLHRCFQHRLPPPRPSRAVPSFQRVAAIMRLWDLVFAPAAGGLLHPTSSTDMLHRLPVSAGVVQRRHGIPPATRECGCVATETRHPASHP